MGHHFWHKKTRLFSSFIGDIRLEFSYCPKCREFRRYLDDGMADGMGEAVRRLIGYEKPVSLTEFQTKLNKFLHANNGEDKQWVKDVLQTFEDGCICLIMCGLEVLEYEFTEILIR